MPAACCISHNGTVARWPMGTEEGRTSPFLFFYKNKCDQHETRDLFFFLCRRRNGLESGDEEEKGPDGCCWSWNMSNGFVFNQQRRSARLGHLSRHVSPTYWTCLMMERNGEEPRPGAQLRWGHEPAGATLMKNQTDGWIWKRKLNKRRDSSDGWCRCCRSICIFIIGMMIVEGHHHCREPLWWWQRAHRCLGRRTARADLFWNFFFFFFFVFYFKTCNIKKGKKISKGETKNVAPTRRNPDIIAQVIRARELLL